MAFDENPVLAQLLAQARGQDADGLALRAVVEEAATLGATRALALLGLEDAQAARDMAELRDLLAAWREAKKSLWKGVLGWVAKMAAVVMLAGLAVKTGFWDGLK